MPGRKTCATWCAPVHGFEALLVLTGLNSVGKPLAPALHVLPAGNLTFAGGIERSVANLDLTLSHVMADDQAVLRDAESA
jgi:hypothetical protein